MTEIVAGIVALLLLGFALRLAGTLQFHRRTRERARLSERALGREIIAELPIGPDLTLFSHDRARFYYGAEQIDKDLIRAVRLLVNGQPIASSFSPRFQHLPPDRLRQGYGESRRSGFAATAEGGSHEDGGSPRGGRHAEGYRRDDRPEGIARDRWDVAIETAQRTWLVECGAIRERVSQELARKIYEAVKADMERRAQGS
ncbi:MAG: hypothetical protein HY654_01280 [Acidobacteria bacterium]|nr:hypothetical protein [Acidobacteriota bacterium]